MKTCSRCHIDKDNSEFRLRYDKRGALSKQYQYLNNTCKKCDTEISNTHYFKNRDNPEFKKKWCAKSQLNYFNNKEKRLVQRKSYRERPDNKIKRKAYIAKNKTKIDAQERICKKRYSDYHRDNVTDQYCIQLIRSQNGIHRNLITPEMIEQKRLSVLIKRKLYEKGKIDAPRNYGRINSVFQGTYQH